MRPTSRVPVVVALSSVALPVLAGRTPQARQQPATAPADLLLTNAVIVTVDEGVPQAEAVAIRGDRIVAAESGTVLRLVGSTRKKWSEALRSKLNMA